MHTQQLLESNIIYAPDFCINAGGIINCYAEYDERDSSFVYQKTEEIYERTLAIFRRAQKENVSTHTIAEKIAKERIDRAQL